MDRGDLQRPSGLLPVHPGEHCGQRVGRVPRPAGVAGRLGGEAERPGQSIMGAGQLRLPRRPGRAQERADLYLAVLRGQPAHIGGSAHHVRKGRVHRVHAVKQPRRQGQSGLAAERGPDLLRPGRGGVEEGQAGVPGPIGGRFPGKVLQIGLAALRKDDQRLRGGGDGVMGRAAPEVRHGPVRPRQQKTRQQPQRIGPAPVDVVTRVPARPAGKGDAPGVPRRGGAGRQGEPVGLPPAAGRTHDGPAQVKSVGIEQKVRPRQPGGVHLLGPLQADLLRCCKQQAQRAVGQAAAQQPQHGGVAQIVVRAQGGAAVGAEETVRLHHRHRLGQRVEAAARGHGTYHVQMPLQDQPGGRPAAGRGRHVGHHVAVPVPDRGQPQFRQPGGQGPHRGAFMPGGVGGAVQGAKFCGDPRAYRVRPAKTLQQRHSEGSVPVSSSGAPDSQRRTRSSAPLAASVRMRSRTPPDRVRLTVVPSGAARAR